MKEIVLTQGKVAKVDDCDFEWLSQWEWHANKKTTKSTYYAMRNVRTEDKKQRTVLMHRLIMDAPPESQVDHRDGDGLNNQRDNLRLATGNQNNCNAGIRRDNSSGYKGVGWLKGNGKWRARIRVNGRSVFLGYFDDKEEAARAHDRAARELHGEFAWLNFPGNRDNV